MSASRERRARKIRSGGVLDAVPEGAVINTVFEMNGERWVELTDGRIAKAPKARIAWAIRDGKVVWDPVG